ncbi:MAG TPA: hypothetical protein DD435_03990 [Cyanobacteria bacterium UBA8530]|nr:hypothetical protein [Cyanobacteria bacterium UBA8530]
MDLFLRPIASFLHDPASLIPLREKLRSWLLEAGVEASFSPDAQSAFLLLTGGTEALTMAHKREAPILLLAHPWHNSLPSALEVKARLDREGIPAALLFLDGSPESINRAVSVIKIFRALQKMKGKRLGVIGPPSDWLVASSDGELAKKLGVELVHIPMDKVFSRLTKDQGLADCYETVAVGEVNKEDLLKASTFYPALKETVKEEKLDALTVRCFDLVEQKKTSGCLAIAELLNQGFIAACEGDLTAGLTMMLGQELSGEIPFMANVARAGAAEVMFTHCTIAPSLTLRYRLRTHFESNLGIGIEGEYASSEVTVSRLGENNRFFVQTGKVLPSPPEEDLCRTQIRVKMDFSYFFEHPLGNHHIVWPGDHRDDWLALEAFGWKSK